MGIFFNTVKATAAVVLTLALGVFTFTTVTAGPDLENHKNVPVAQMTLEQKASHMIIFLNSEGSPMSLCTSTAIGPHALMTASHCNKSESSTSVMLDRSPHKYNLLEYATDDRDHKIYLIDGPAFENAVTVTEVEPVSGDHVTFYGFGEGVYPSSVRQGHVLPPTDPSDVDAQSGTFEIAIPVYHGDSGSAIYNDIGEVVGIVSWGASWYGSPVEGSFSLAFTQEQLEIAAEYPKDGSLVGGGFTEMKKNPIDSPFGV